MFALFAFVVGLILQICIVAFACHFIKIVTLHWRKYVAVQFIMFLWFDMAMGFKAGLVFALIPLIPLVVSIVILRNPTSNNQIKE